MGTVSMNQALADLQAMLDAANAAAPRRPQFGTTTADLLDPRLHAYQRRAVTHLHQHPKAGLFLEMGLGKTASVLQALQPDHFPVLVVAPKRVAEQVWPYEREIWSPHLSMELAAGSPAKRTRALASGAQVVVIGRDNIKDVRPGQFRTVVLDELSSFKNRGSQRWKMARKICDAAAYVYGLTGTPAPNGLMDLWAQIYLLDGGERLGRTLTAYRNRFFNRGRTLPNGVVIEWNLKSGAREQIEKLVSDICLSMKSEDYLELPPVIHNEVRVPLSPKTRKVYDQMVTDLVLQTDDKAYTAKNPAVLTGRLSQITAGFLYPDVEDAEIGEGKTIGLHDEKTAAAVEIVEGTGSPVLVFYRYKEELARLQAALPDARRIDEPGVIADWNAGKVPVVLAHPSSAGHGLNLQRGGHTIIWSTMPWSLEEWAQANARLDRQGQTHPVTIHRLVSPDTIDELIYLRLMDKISTQDAIMRALKQEPS